MLQLGSGVVKRDFPRIYGYVVSLRLPPEDWLKSEPFLEAGGGGSNYITSLPGAGHSFDFHFTLHFITVYIIINLV